MLCERGASARAKIIKPGPPVRFTQADLGRNCSLLSAESMDQSISTRFSRLFNPFPTTNFSFFKLKDLADDNFNAMKMAESYPKREENNAGKGEIARYEQFLLFPQCFQKTPKPRACLGKG